MNVRNICVAILFILGTDTVWTSEDAWISLGLEGRSIQALGIDPKNPGTLYVGTTWDGRYDGEIFKSIDGGTTWRALGLGVSKLSVLALVLDPQNPQTMYTAAWGHGVFKSADGGASWVNSVLPGGLPARYVTPGVSLPEANFISALAIDPMEPAIVYAGSGARCCPWASRVFKSTDGGIHWVTSELMAAGVSSLAIDPQHPSILYAGHSDGIDGEGGISKSVDGGITWTDVGAIVEGNVLALEIDPQRSGTIYAGTMTWDADRRGYIGKIFRSWDGSGSWLKTLLPMPAVGDQQDTSLVSALAIDPKNAGTLYAATNTFGRSNTGNVFKSTDGGTSWADSGLTVDRVTSLAIDPQDPSRVYAGTRGTGLFVTLPRLLADGGRRVR
jgi:photosystem II stability/assembly factor-like uncharacterized protein